MKIKIPGKSITAVEITTNYIKLSQALVSPRGRIINKLLVRDRRLDASEDIAKPLNEMLSASRIKATNIILIIPRQFLTFRVIRLPSQDNKEIEKMVSLQLSKQIPWPVEDIASDYSIIEKDASGYSKVLLAVCQKEVIKRYLNIIFSAGLKIDRVTLSSEGVCRWYQNFSNRNNIKDVAPVVLLDIDTENCDICFYHKENLLFTRSVSFCVADLRSEKLDNLTEELRKTLSTLQRDQITSEIGKIFIITAGEGTNILADKLNSEFACEVAAVNPVKEIIFGKELIIPLALSEGKCSGASILGLSLGQLKNELNLLPKEIKKEEQEKSNLKELISLGILLFLLLVFSAGVLAAKIYKKEQYFKKLDTILNGEGPKAKEIENFIKKLNLVKERLNPLGSGIDVIYELYNLIPEGVSLSIFSFEEGGLITLQGISLNMSDVFSFQSILEKSPYFKNVEVKYASKRKVRQAELTDFRITCVVDYENIRKPK